MTGRFVYGAGGAEQEVLDGPYKTCPRCGARLFEDMDVCYGCLFDFTHQPADVGLPDPEEVLGVQGPPAEEVPPEELPDAAGSELSAEVERSESVQGPQFPSVPEQPEISESSEEPAAVNAAATTARKQASRPAHAATEPAEAPAGDKTISLGQARPKPSGIAVRVLTRDFAATVPVEMPGLSVGRDDANDLVVRSRAVSRRHVFLCPTERGLFLEDLGATNPALVDGVPMGLDQEVLPGSIIDICGARLEVVCC